MIHPYKGVSPAIHPTVYIVDSAQVIGDVHIGEYSSAWFNAVIRGDVNYIRIGRRTNIQDGCLLHVTRGTHPLFLGDDVTLGHGVTLHGCRIKDRCLIGMGAVILDGAEVGEDAMVAAGAVVREGTVVPPRSLFVGVPAVKARELTDGEIKGILVSANNYIEYSKSYRGG